MSNRFSFSSADELISLLTMANTRLREKNRHLLGLTRSMAEAFRDDDYAPLAADMVRAVMNCEEVSKNISLITASVRRYRDDLYQLYNEKPAKTAETAGVPAASSLPCSISVSERTLFELDVLENSLELTAGDPSVIQAGGSDKDVKKRMKDTGYESHHIPPQSVFAETRRNLPTVALTKEDHALTSSFRWRMQKQYKPYFPGENAGIPKHKQDLQAHVEQGLLAEMIRNELYEMRETFGNKYDGAIRQYLAAMRDYIQENGVPEVAGYEGSPAESKK